MTFIDTNYFLRFFLEDITKQHDKVKQLFLSASKGKTKMFTSVIVFFEVYWVLQDYYGKTKGEILDVLFGILDMDFIWMENKAVLRESVSVYERSSLDLKDSFNLAYAKSLDVKEFKTFDKKLLKFFSKKP